MTPVEQNLAAAEREIANLRLELKNAQAERMFASAEVSRIANERNNMMRQARLLEDAEAREKDLVEQLAAAQTVQRQILDSLSWRVTAPLRALAEKLRRARR